MNKDLNDDNFLMYAIKNYKNPGMTGMSELEDDLKRFKYLKRLFNRYLKTGEPNERLIINHLILLYNVFGNATTKMLFYKTEDKHYSILKTFLVFLNRIPLEEVYTKGLVPEGKNINDIMMDEELIKVLRKI
jgi:hypothetical protein|tara:strand:- start:7201 stop:7596 length:396 start_codon:yes stop_codon:yes gene_type:complete